VAPGLGTAIGTGVGLVLGAGADWIMNKRREKKGRKQFIEANGKALDTTIKQWKGKLGGNVQQAVDRWFEDAKTGMILSHQRKHAPKPAAGKSETSPTS
jgi:hypothetical protein